PSPMPAGILTVISRRFFTRPSPPQWLQGSVITSPKPWHCGHGREVITLPRKERCTSWISPAPPQPVQVTGLAFDAEPEPEQRSHNTAVSTVTVLRIPA